MKVKFIISSFFLFSHFVTTAQNIFKAKVVDSNTKDILKGATASIPELKLTVSTDSSGLIIIPNIPNGKFNIEISFTGYVKSGKVYSFPMQNIGDTIPVSLESKLGELAEVFVQTTRTNQNLRDIPTRIEALPLEELDEKSTMRPGDIKMLLGEATGIHVQQSSAVSGSANFRIQGLDSR